MKLSKKLVAITAAMQPGQIACDGFLGNDPRSLAAIMAADQAAVNRIGLSHRQIARRMIEFRDAGQKACGDWITIPPRWEVRVDSARGKLLCPFGDPGLYPKTSITVRDIQNGTEITFTDLHIHLIGRHGFYEGSGCAFRVEPARLAEVLDIN
ncbi:MAG: hypothetical protein L6455_16010 [Kiritimatiellae bacterium]|nr:hypothetical protein [Kiritimatiellia bacterium]